MSFANRRVVVDSNILVSAAIYPDSSSAQSLLLAARFCVLFRSDETTEEIEQVLLRGKFDRYFSEGGPQRERFLEVYKQVAILAPITKISTDCLDSKDNKFLSLALSVDANILVSGDRKHLLPMHPYQGIQILSSADFLRVLLADIS